MNMQKLLHLRPLLCQLIAIFVLSACSIDDNPVPEPVIPGQKDYVERLVPVVAPNGESQGTVTLRFYNDMPNVAYVSISDFQRMMVRAS